MPLYGWTAGALAHDAVITSANINAEGNGSPVAAGFSGTATNPYNAATTSSYRIAAVHDSDGDGFSFIGVAGSTARIDTGDVGGAELVSLDFTLVLSSLPTASDLALIVGRNAGSTETFSSYLNLRTSANGGQFRAQPATGTANMASSLGYSSTTSTSPVVTAGKYRIRFATVRNTLTAPSTTNGRIQVEITNLTDSSWNTTGKWVFDSGYTVDVTVDKPKKYRVGKTSSGTVLSDVAKIVKWSWYTSDSPTTTLTSAEAVKNFPPAGAPSVSTTETGDAYVIRAVGTASAGGSLTYSIVQTGGSTFTPISLSTGVWKVQRDSYGNGSRSYEVSVSEAGGGTAVVPFTVTEAAQAGGRYQRLKRVGGVWL